MAVPLLPFVTTTGAAVWNSCVNAFNLAFGRTIAIPYWSQQI